MKACLERSPRPSVLDGRWIEGCLEGVTGWAVGQDDDVPRDTSEESALYHKLESIIVPMYYGWPSAFWEMMALGDLSQRLVLQHPSDAGSARQQPLLPP